MYSRSHGRRRCRRLFVVVFLSRKNERAFGLFLRHNDFVGRWCSSPFARALSAACTYGAVVPGLPTFRRTYAVLQQCSIVDVTPYSSSLKTTVVRTSSYALCLLGAAIALVLERRALLLFWDVSAAAAADAVQTCTRV